MSRGEGRRLGLPSQSTSFPPPLPSPLLPPFLVIPRRGAGRRRGTAGQRPARDRPARRPPAQPGRRARPPPPFHADPAAVNHLRPVLSVRGRRCQQRSGTRRGPPGGVTMQGMPRGGGRSAGSATGPARLAGWPTRAAARQWPAPRLRAGAAPGCGRLPPAPGRTCPVVGGPARPLQVGHWLPARPGPGREGQVPGTTWGGADRASHNRE